MIYLSLHCHHLRNNDSCIKMGSDESHFNVSVGSDGQSHKTVSTNHNLRVIPQPVHVAVHVVYRTLRGCLCEKLSLFVLYRNRLSQPEKTELKSGAHSVAASV